MDDEFSQQRVRLIRELAAKADKLTKRRVLDLVRRYDDTTGRWTTFPIRSPTCPSVSNYS